MSVDDTLGVGKRQNTWFVVGSVSGAHFLSHFYLLIFPPLFPLLQREFGLNNAELGVIFSAVFVAPSLLQVPVGEVVDRTGAKRVLVVGMLVTSFGTMLVGLANSYLILVLFVLVAGIGQAAFHPADFALLEASSTEATRGKSFGVHTFAGFLGFAAAPAIVGTLGLRYGWETALVLGGVVGLAYAAFLYLSLDTVHLDQIDEAGSGETSERTWRDALAVFRRPPILMAFLFFVVITIAGMGIQAFTTLFVSDHIGFTEAVGNLALTTNLTLTALGVLVGGVLADRYNIYAIMFSVLSLAALVAWVIVSGVVGPSVMVLLLLFAIMGLAHGLALPSRDSMISNFSTSGSTGKSFGFAYTGITIGSTIAPVTLGAVIDATNLPFGFTLIGGLYLCSALVVLAIYVRYRSAATRSEPQVA